jgi:hypothetical protein
MLGLPRPWTTPTQGPHQLHHREVVCGQRRLPELLMALYVNTAFGESIETLRLNKLDDGYISQLAIEFGLFIRVNSLDGNCREKRAVYTYIYRTLERKKKIL